MGAGIITGQITLTENDAIILSDTYWEDLQIKATQTKLGANNKPDYDYTNQGLLFPKNDADEKIYDVMQMRHKKKMNTSVYMHVHYIQNSATKPTFKLSYRFYNNGAVVTEYATISTGTGTGASKGIYTYTSGNMLQIATFPAIVSPTNEMPSANLDIIFWREDNDMTGDCLVKYIDIHYEIDNFGSKEEYSK